MAEIMQEEHSLSSTGRGLEEKNDAVGDPHVLEGKLIRKKKRVDKFELAIRKDPHCNEEGEWVHPVSQVFIYPRVEGKDQLPEFMFLAVKVKVTYLQHGEERIAKNFALLESSHDPIAVGLALEWIAEGKYPWTIIPALEEQDKDPMDHLQEILALPKGRKRRLAIARLVRGLENGPGAAVDRPARRRPPFIRPKEWLLVQELERRRDEQKCGLRVDWEWMEPQMLAGSTQEETNSDYDETQIEAIHTEDTNENNIPQLMNIPENSHDQISHNKKALTRGEYFTSKKVPQVRRMVQRIEHLFAVKGGKPYHIIDVGGGRGDLATAIALAFPEAIVSVVDINESSLQAGMKYAQELGCAERMNFCFSDMEKVMKKMAISKPPGSLLNEQESVVADDCSFLLEDSLSMHGAQSLPPVDLVVGLHACGDLSDLALTFSNHLQIPFVLCPCCYTKRYLSLDVGWDMLCPVVKEEENQSKEELKPLFCKSIRRLAELDQNPQVSRVARVAINSMRLHNAKQSGGYDVSLEEYEAESSSRSLVLVGCSKRLS